MPLSSDGMERKENLRATGAPVACATVLRWAPSRVTRRGALTATAAAAAAAAIFPSLPLCLSSSAVRLVSPLRLGPFCRSPLGPAGPVAPPPRGPWSRGSQSSPLQNTPSLFRLLPNAATDALLLLFFTLSLFLSPPLSQGTSRSQPTFLRIEYIYICIYILTLLWSRGRSEFSR